MRLPFPILWFDLDNRLHEMSNAAKYIEDGKIVVWPFDDPLLVGSIRARQTSIEVRGRFQTIGPPKSQPKGYIHLLEKLEEARDFVEKAKIQTIVMDPMTRGIEHMVRFLQYQTKHGVIEESAWGIYLSNLEELMSHILALPCNKILIFHSRDYMDEETGRRVQTKPLVSGQFQGKVASYFAEVWYTHVTHSGEGPEWMIRTQPAPWIECRTSKNLDEVMPAYFPTILEKGGWSDKPFTVMLFGPPGSGKTSLALSLCEVKEESCTASSVESKVITSTSS